MMTVTATMVKDLRDTTGVGMMDAKKALTETNGDMEAAIDWLRAKGLAKAAKKSGRTAAEGLVGVAVRGGIGVAVEVNCETDFAARNAEFQALVARVTEAALDARDLTELLAAKIGGETVADLVTAKIATIGENMQVRRMARLDGTSVAAYVHNAAAPGMGKIGVLVALDAADNGVGKQVAMHVAAAAPASLSEADLDPALIEREKGVLTEQARASGKPDAVIEKMIAGRMNKFFEEVTLLNQKFVINPDVTVRDAAAAEGAKITGFARLQVGEGVEKETEDFAAEVAKTRGA
jgi:elongation factor Ts